MVVVSRTLLKTITMMAGELEFEDIFYGDTAILYPVTAHGMFVAFVLLVTVILTNLLVGLAVSDIQGLQASAGLDRLSRQAELVARLESLFFSRLLRKAPRGIILLCQRSALLRTSRYHLQFCIRPNDPRDTRLPKDIVVSIYKLVAERRDRNQSIKRKRREQNLSYLPRSYYNSDSLRDVQIRNRATYVAGTRSNSDNPTAQNLTPNIQPISGEMEQSMEMLKLHMQNITYKLNELQNAIKVKMGNARLDGNIVKKAELNSGNGDIEV